MDTTTIVTHSGRFHADDIFAVASIELFLEHSENSALQSKPIHVIRTRDAAIIKKGDFVVDVGGIYDPENNYFDHHQHGGAGARVNGLPYASFGLVWKKYGEHIAGSAAVAEMIDRKIVQSIDAHDNGVRTYVPLHDDAEPYLFDDFIFSFYPTWKDQPGAFDSIFLELVEVAKGLIRREVAAAAAKAEAAIQVNQAYAAAADKRIVVLEQYLPWKDILTGYPEPLFVVYPVPEDATWHVGAVSAGTGRTFKNRKDFPEIWAGKTGADLAKVTGVTDAVFCHNKLFLAVAGSLDGALRLAKKALQA